MSSDSATEDATEVADSNHILPAFGALRQNAADAPAAGRLFERVIARALGAYPAYSFADVWLWADWPDRAAHGFAQDIGVDVVARTTDGKLWAVQTKFYTGTVPKEGVDSFLSMMSGDVFDRGLLVYTGSLTAHSQTKLDKAAPRVQVASEADLAGWPIDWEAAIDPLRGPVVVAPKEPKTHQRAAVRAVLEGFESSDRGRVVMPCGTGKSLTGLWAAEGCVGGGGTVLVTVPSISLISQMMREWASNQDLAIRHRYFGICSDPSTGRLEREAASEFARMPDVSVTTAPADIAAELSVPVDPAEMRVVFSTYQSVPVLSGALADASGFDGFDLMICDEAHRTTGVEHEGRKGSDGSGFHQVHDDALVPAAKRLYMTATPRVFTERLRTRLDGEETNYWSMDDEETYGPMFYRMSFSDAIGRKLLTDYEVIVVAKQTAPALGGPDRAAWNWDDLLRKPDADTGKSPTESKRDLQLAASGYATKLLGVLDAMSSPMTAVSSTGRVAGEIDPRWSDPAAHDALESETGRPAADYAPMRSAILFANTVYRSRVAGQQGCFAGDASRGLSLLEEVSAGLGAKHPARDVLSVATRHMDGSTRADGRARSLHWLREAGELEPGAECRIVSNSKVLSEGVDVPSLDAVVFMDPRGSAVDVTQAVGRAIRLSEGKNHGRIVIPVVMAPGSNDTLAERIMEAEGFKTVLEVVRALRSHDDRADLWLTDTVRPPIRFIVDAEDDSSGDEGEDSTRVEQLTLADIDPDLENKVFSKITSVCGDKRLWASWGRRASAVCKAVAERTAELLVDDDPGFTQFVDDLKATVGEQVTPEAARQMVAQHVVTIPVFDSLFPANGFAKENPLSKSMDRLLTQMAARQGIVPSADSVGYGLALQVFANELAPLHDSYESMVRILTAAADDPVKKMDRLREIYDEFFAHAMKRETEKLGIVYTPVEIVDFTILASDTVCRRHFGRGLTDEGVNILEPFVGTGTFMRRLLTIEGADGNHVIRDEDLRRKYDSELYAQELVLLAYYIAALSIEAGMESRDGFADGKFDQFVNIAHGNTFIGDGPAGFSQLDMGLDNTAANQRVKGSEIHTVIGNPPWSAGQKSSADDNQSDSNPEVAARVSETYGRSDLVKGVGQKALGNMYVQAIRWASDRINGDGMIAFVHPNSLSTATSLAGMRAALRDEFTDIYVVNLRGDAYKSGEEAKAEGLNVFAYVEMPDGSEVRHGTGSRNGVQITILVKDASADSSVPATLHYAEVPDYSGLRDKFDWLEALRPGTEEFFSKFTEVPVNDAHDWVNLTDGSFEQLPIALYSSSKPQRGKGVGECIAVSSHAQGVNTASDAFAYAFGRGDLVAKIRPLIDEYNRVRTNVSRGEDIADAVASSPKGLIKWHDVLKRHAKRGTPIEFDEDRIRRVLYRPFTTVWLYEDDRIVNSVRRVASMFPRLPGDGGYDLTVDSGGGAAISCRTGRGISVLATRVPTDLGCLSTTGGSTRVSPRRS